jgi:transcriptional regulator with XRE-family HTH domain
MVEGPTHSPLNSTSVNRSTNEEDMVILDDRIRLIRKETRSPREQRHLSMLADQYLLQLENTEILPDIDTLEIWAKALGVPVASLFYESGKTPELRYLKDRLTCEDIVRRSSAS